MADELEGNYLLAHVDSDDGLDAFSLDGHEGVAIAGIAAGDEDVYSDLQLASNPQAQLTQAQCEENKKRKRKDKDKQRKQKRAALAAEYSDGVGSLATQPPDMQADYLSSKQRATFSKLSALQLEELRLTERMLIDTTTFDQPRKEDSLAAFVRKYAPKTVKALADASAPLNTQRGRPGVLVLTGNAQRAADLAKALRPLNPSPKADEPGESNAGPRKKKLKTSAGGAKQAAAAADRGGRDKGANFTVGKLFARHFKLGEHQEWLQEHVCPLATGTPQRVASLVSSDDLKLDELEAIVIDQTWVDTKQRTVLDTPETRDELVKLLGSDKVLAALKRADQPVKLALF